MTIGECIFPPPVDRVNIVSNKFAILYNCIQASVGLKGKKSGVDHSKIPAISFMKLFWSQPPVTRSINSKFEVFISQVSNKVIGNIGFAIQRIVRSEYMY